MKTNMKKRIALVLLGLAAGVAVTWALTAKPAPNLNCSALLQLAGMTDLWFQCVMERRR